MKYLKEFNTVADYEAAKDGLITPNVSLITETMGVEYNPSSPTPTETIITTKYNVTDTSNPTKIGYKTYTSGFSAIEIDGVVQESVVSAYTFDTTGEHIVKYTLSDPTTIVMRTFQSCGNLTSVIIPNSVTSIGSYAFSECTSLTSVTISNGITIIPEYSFQYCSSLTSIDIPSGVATIDYYAFNQCTSLTSITIPNSVTRINTGAFNKTPWVASYSADTNNHYGNIVYINDVAFTAVSTSITSCTFKETTVSICDSAFYRCSGLTSVNIPDNVTYIATSAFNTCSGLTNVTIGSSVLLIGNNAFYKCSGVTDVYCYPNPSTLTWYDNSSDDFKSGKATNCHVKSESLSDYQTKFTLVNVTFVGDLT